MGDGTRARQGSFEMAEGGVVYLYEIDEMPLPMQVKLLRVLQEKRFQRLGGGKSIQSDVRVIAASRRSLEDLVAQGKFREDLYYRLNVFPIEVPPLRERRGDIPLLVQELIARIESENRGSVRLSRKAVAMLQHYDWPGNVRELANLIERLAILFPHGLVDSRDLPARYQNAAGGMEEDASAGESAAQAVEQLGELPSDGIDMKKYLTDIEISLIEQALTRTNHVVARAANMLNMRRTTLVEKMRKYEIERAE
jgi:sigma-54 specific flagellar transcriptional regulator A